MRVSVAPHRIIPAPGLARLVFASLVSVLRYVEIFIFITTNEFEHLFHVL